MASSYSTDLKFELMVTGENSGTWGDKTNTNLNLIQQAVIGYEGISIAGGAQTTALVMSNATISNARNAIIKFTGTITGNQIVTIPDGIEKPYVLYNGTTGAFTVQFKTVSGTGTTFSTIDKGIKFVYSDGTNVVDINSLLSTINLPFQNELRFGDADNSNYASLYAASTITSNVSFSIPSSLPTVTNAALVGTTTGVLSFTTYAPISTGKSIAMTLVFS